jgi:hypothetical protein
MYSRILFVLLSLILFIQIKAKAQAAAPEIREILPEKGIYRFPVFNEGSIIFRNGIISTARMNFNVSLDEIHFINEKGDTLSLADPAAISFINLNNSRFYYDKSFLQTIGTSTVDGVTLAFKQSLSAQQQKKVGAYDMSQAHEGKSGLKLFNGHGEIYNLGANDNIMVTAKEIYFFGDAYGHFEKASKDYILDHYNKDQPALKEFIKTNHINFNVLKDLLKLMEFCIGLKQ